MSFFGKLFKVAKKVAPVAIGYALTGTPIGAAVGGAAGSALRGGNISQIIQGAAAGYGAGATLGAGTAALGASGANLAPGAAGPITGGISGAGQVFGNAITGGIGSDVLGGASKLVQAASLMGGSGGGAVSQPTRSPIAPKEKPFSPLRPDAMARPGSLAELSPFSNEQERSAIATKGVNTGLGQDEMSYYRNLLQRSLIGEGNKVNTDNPNFLMPIESSYLSGRGNNTNDIMSLLKSLQA